MVYSFVCKVISIKFHLFPPDNTDVVELRSFLDVNFSPVFHIFYEAFITFEGNLKQKGKAHPIL